MKYPQSKFWLLTIPYADFLPPTQLDESFSMLRGQRELAASGFDHWQLVVAFKRKVRLAGVKSYFGETCHAEPSRSSAANDYVFKEDTAVEGTRFSLGDMPFKTNSAVDWATVRANATRGDLASIPDRIYVAHYRTLRAIAADNARPAPIERRVVCYWGPTGTGKSRRAWFEAGINAYPKDPRSKFWDGYQGQRHVIIDEFRGAIDIAHLLRWFDRYPVIVEVKGASVVLKAEYIWVTSNLHPREWFVGLDFLTLEALLRRIDIVEINTPWTPPLDEENQQLLNDILNDF